MNTPPHYLPHDMVLPPPAIAPTKDENLFIVVHTRMEQTEREIQIIVAEIEEYQQGEG